MRTLGQADSRIWLEEPTHAHPNAYGCVVPGLVLGTEAHHGSYRGLWANDGPVDGRPGEGARGISLRALTRYLSCLAQQEMTYTSRMAPLMPSAHPILLGGAPAVLPEARTPCDDVPPHGSSGYACAGSFRRIRNPALCSFPLPPSQGAQEGEAKDDSQPITQESQH